MSDKLKQLEIKKLLTEYSFLLSDGEYKKEIISENTPKFMESLSNRTGKEGNKSSKNDKKESSSNKQNKIEVIKKLQDSELSKDTKIRMKKMFRNIVKVTHPDKVNSQDLIDLYIKAKESYETNDLLELSYVAEKLDMEIIFDYEEISLLKKLIEVKKTELSNIEKSWLWLWSSKDNQEYRDSIIELYYNKIYKPIEENNNNNNMENLEQILNEIYGQTPYLEYRNKTEFKKEYSATYGEVTKESTNTIVNQFKEHFNENTVFYDLGCGLGKMVIHVALQYNPKKSCGIELSKERLKGANDLKEKHCKDNKIISFIEGDFFSNDFSDATVVYIDNTAMSHDITKKIIDNLKKGCLFICRKKPDFIETEELIGEKFKTGYNKPDIHFLIKE
jgi:SAM-dependent methyltransferase